MSYRADASYWGVISGPKADCEAILRTMQERDIVPTYLDTPEGIQPNDGAGQDMATIRLEVPGGSMERWSDADETFARLASNFPSLDITLEEKCEEPSFPDCKFTYIKGERQDPQYGRILGVDDVDAVTVARCVAYLRECGQSAAANMLAARF